MTGQVPDYHDVKAAGRVLAGKAVRTPLLKNMALSELAGADVYLKPECLQHTGSFKFRGAYNAISSLPDAERARGIVACSSGNHAQGVGKAASIFGCPATILMPSDAPASKVSGTLATGAKIVEYDRASQDREKMVAELVARSGGILIHPYNNKMVVAGQGTAGLEIAEDLNSMGKSADRVLVCTGGGGLTAGVALAIHHHFPEAKIHSVEPEGFDDYRHSLASGKIMENSQTTGSVCDAVLTPEPGAIGFEINRRILSEGLAVSDDEALMAVKFAFEKLKLVVEPGGAVALAALLKQGRQWSGETIAVLLSGGNVDPQVFRQAISS